MDHSNLSIKKGGKNIPANWQVYIIINDANLPPPYLHLFARLQILMRLSLPLPHPASPLWHLMRLSLAKKHFLHPSSPINEAKSGNKQIFHPSSPLNEAKSGKKIDFLHLFNKLDDRAYYQSGLAHWVALCLFLRTMGKDLCMSLN